MKEMNVHTLCNHKTVKGQGLTLIETRWVFTNIGDTERSCHPCQTGCSGDEEDDKDGPNGHIHDVRCDPPVEGFRFLLSRAMTGEKKRNPQDELVMAFFDISRAHFHSPVRRKVAIRMQSDP